MKMFAESLLADLDGQLEIMQPETANPLQYCETAIKAIIAALAQLQAY